MGTGQARRETPAPRPLVQVNRVTVTRNGINSVLKFAGTYLSQSTASADTANPHGHWELGEQAPLYIYFYFYIYI
jgi:hypothetical protein